VAERARDDLQPHETELADAVEHARVERALDHAPLELEAVDEEWCDEGVESW
jgi:hypothetical protein